MIEVFATMPTIPSAAEVGHAGSTTVVVEVTVVVVVTVVEPSTVLGVDAGAAVLLEQAEPPRAAVKRSDAPTIVLRASANRRALRCGSRGVTQAEPAKRELRLATCDLSARAPSAETPAARLVLAMSSMFSYFGTSGPQLQYVSPRTPGRPRSADHTPRQESPTVRGPHATPRVAIGPRTTRHAESRPRSADHTPRQGSPSVRGPERSAGPRGGAVR